MAKIKIAHILHCVGGVDISLRLILENLDCDRFESIVLHGKADTNKDFHDAGGKIVRNYRIDIVRNIVPLKDLAAIWQAIRILRRERPDIIHGHSAKGGIVGRVAGKILKIRVLYTPQAFSYLSARRSLLRKAYLFIERIFANGNTFLLASSLSEQHRAINEVLYKPSATGLFNNSILPVTGNHPLRIMQTWPDEYICTVGRPSYQKNIELMLDVIYKVRNHRPIHLVLMGVGHHSGRLKAVTEKISRLALEPYVTMLDWTSREDVLHIISRSQLYISTARYEGLPYSVIESLALGKSCVVSDCDGNRDLVVDGYNGFVISSAHAEDYAEKILTLLQDQILREKFERNAKATFFQSFDIRLNIRFLEEIYRQNTLLN